MPLVELGLVSRLKADDASDLSDQPDSSQRCVRCVAGFYGDLRNAESVAHELRIQFGLRDDQVDVIHPDGLTRQGFDRVARRWQCLRPRWDRMRQGLNLLTGTATGMVAGTLAAMLGWLIGGGEGGSDALSWLLPGLWAGAIAGAVTAAVVHGRQPRHRFDSAVARKLGRGYCAVVAHGLSHEHEAPVLAYLQDTSHSWCAEAPRRGMRL